MRMDLADLRLFLCVVDAGSITAGAARANLALASASERLRAIETDAGVELLLRHPRGVTPTEAGDALAHHARLILQQRSRLRDELQDFAQGARGTLHLYANTAALTDFLPPPLAPWLAERPKLRVDLKERTSIEIVRAVSAGLAEAGIVSDAVAADGLHLQPVAKDHLVLIVPPKHRLARHTSVVFADVLGEAFIALADGNALQEHINLQAQDAGRALAARVHMKTFEGVCAMVGHGVGIAVVPQAQARRFRRTHGYQVVALRDDWARRHLCLCFAQWKTLSSAMRSLLLHLGAVAPH
ncbi:LysR family transcriptional regulator [Stenotrophomonas sp. Iso1]|uniref:LysR family transcriptional regulator n=1 Tax=Stenotrophomonas sp. Iso1 TaxID=2977283 RepID=UPI0022B78240|nr:LysR family transcriptional regulator [Stenotrophomonas sp. Iso1]